MTSKDVFEIYGYGLHKLFKKCSSIINTSWYYSMHWGKHPKERHWTMDAKNDCQQRILDAEKELSELRKIKSELEEICPLFYPETEELIK